LSRGFISFLQPWAIHAWSAKFPARLSVTVADTNVEKAAFIVAVQVSDTTMLNKVILTVPKLFFPYFLFCTYTYRPAFIPQGALRQNRGKISFRINSFQTFAVL